MFRPVEEEFGPSPLKQMKEEGLKRGNSQFLEVKNNAVGLIPSSWEGQVWLGPSQWFDASANVGWMGEDVHLPVYKEAF